MSPRSSGLLVLGVTVALAAVVLLVWINAGDDKPAQATAQVEAQPTERPAPPALAPTGGVTQTEAPRLPEPAAGSADGVREYVVGDRLVRDHRKGNKPPIDIPPAVHAPDGRKLDSTVTQEVGQKIKDVLKQCAADLPPEARGEKARLEGLAVVSIKNKQLTVTKATVQLRNVVGASVDAVKQCIESKSVGITTSAAEEADLETYDINLSYAI